MQVYCSGELLSAVQLSGVFEDSKDFVDSPMRSDPEVILQVSQSPARRETFRNHVLEWCICCIIHAPRCMNRAVPDLSSTSSSSSSWS